jgi:hypothetical protein
MKSLITFSVVAVLYYGPGKRLLFRFIGLPLSIKLSTARTSVSAARNYAELMVASVSHIVVALAMVRYYGIDHSCFEWPSVNLLGLGVGLGISEMALGSLLCRLAISLLSRYGMRDTSLEQWLAISRGGWLQHHLGALMAAPAVIALCFTALQVSAEEIVFRAVLGGLLRSLFGPAIVITISTVLFSGMQVFHTASWRNAIFPILGATVMGVIHMYLFLLVPNVWPLIVAHITFFMIAIL